VLEPEPVAPHDPRNETLATPLRLSTPSGRVLAPWHRGGCNVGADCRSDPCAQWDRKLGVQLREAETFRLMWSLGRKWDLSALEGLRHYLFSATRQDRDNKTTQQEIPHMKTPSHRYCDRSPHSRFWHNAETWKKMSADAPDAKLSDQEHHAPSPDMWPACGMARTGN